MAKDRSEKGNNATRPEHQRGAQEGCPIFSGSPADMADEEVESKFAALRKVGEVLLQEVARVSGVSPDLVAVELIRFQD